MEDGFSGFLAKGAFKVLAVVQGEVVARDGLAAVFVDALEDLVAGCVAEAGEEGDEFAAGGGAGFVFEDYGFELGGAGDLDGCGGLAFFFFFPRLRFVAVGR